MEARAETQKGWVKVAGLAELPPGSMTCVEPDGRPIAIYHLDDGSLWATDAICSHQYALLTTASLKTTWSNARCMRRSSMSGPARRFSEPAEVDLKTYEVRSRGWTFWSSYDLAWKLRGRGRIAGPAIRRRNCSVAKLPSLVALRAFEAVARRKSIRRAAEELAIDHTVVGRHLRALQTSLAVQLVNTTRRGVQLTPIGEQIAAVGDRLCRIASATAQLENERRAKSFRIWVSPAFAMIDWSRASRGPLAFPAAGCRAAFDGRCSEFFPDGGRHGHHLWGHAGSRRPIGPAQPSTRLPGRNPGWLAKHKIERPQQLLGQTLIHAESSSQWEDWFQHCGVQFHAPCQGRGCGTCTSPPKRPSWDKGWR